VTEETESVAVDVVRANSRRSGLFQTSAEWVVFLDDEDEPDGRMLDALVAAQAASGADAVTCAVRTGRDVHVFLGDPGALGLVENQYGVVALLRASLAVSAHVSDGVADPDWPLLSTVALAGAKVVSLPEPLAEHTGKPGRVDDVPGDAVVVLEAFEQLSTRPHDLPQLAATLAAGLVRATAPTTPAPGQHDGFLWRVSRRLGVR